MFSKIKSQHPFFSTLKMEDNPKLSEILDGGRVDKSYNIELYNEDILDCCISN